MALHRIFVYGTLKRGHPNYFLLSDPNAKYGVAKFVGVARLVKRFPLVVATQYSIPFILAVEGQGKQVSGELYDVDDQMLASLDNLESHPHLYRRTTLQCVIEQTTSPNDTQPVTDCEVYMIHDYNPALMSLPFLSCYDNAAFQDRPYAYREDRDEGFDVFSDVKAK